MSNFVVEKTNNQKMRGRKKLYLLLYVLLIACSNSTRIELELEQVERCLQTVPDSALFRLNLINPDDIRRRKTYAKYALLYSQALDKNEIDLDSDSIIYPAIKYYKYHGRKIDKAKTWYYLARIYENAGDLDRAIASYLEAEKYMVDTRARKLLAMLYANVGNLYVTQYSFSDAEIMYDKSILTYHGLNTINEAYAMAGKSNALHLQNRSDEALKLLDEAEKIASSHADSECLLYLIHARVAILSDVELGNNSLETIKQSVFEAYKRYNNGEPDFQAYPLLSFCCYYVGEVDSAQYYALKAYEHMSKYASFQVQGLYDLLAMISEATGDVASANDYLNERIILADSLYEVNKSNLIQDLERKYHTEQVTQSYIRLRHQHVATMIFSILVIVIFGCMAWILYTKKKAQQNEYLSFAHSLHSDYSSLHERYMTLEKELGQTDMKSKRLFTALDNRLEELRKILEYATMFENNPSALYERLRRSFKFDYKKSGTFFNDLFDITNLYYGDIVERLRNNYPNLNDEDLALCCMIRLGFSPQQTRLLFNHTNSTSIYQKRSKLRKKLGLSDVDNLEDFFARNLSNQARI